VPLRVGLDQAPRPDVRRHRADKHRREHGRATRFACGGRQCGSAVQRKPKSMSHGDCRSGCRRGCVCSTERPTS
jgi:hypothetical protein